VGFAYDEINAVAAIGCDDPSETLDRAEAIHRIRSSSDFEAVSIAFKRIKNILKQAEPPPDSVQVEPAAAESSLEPAESGLFAFLDSAKAKIEKLSAAANTSGFWRRWREAGRSSISFRKDHGDAPGSVDS